MRFCAIFVVAPACLLPLDNNIEDFFLRLLCLSGIITDWCCNADECIDNLTFFYNIIIIFE